MTTRPVKPFGSPVPGQSPDVIAVNTRGNDNVLAKALNAIADLQNAVEGLAARGAGSANLFDPRLAANDGDHIIASQSFGRHRF